MAFVNPVVWLVLISKFVGAVMVMSDVRSEPFRLYDCGVDGPVPVK